MELWQLIALLAAGALGVGALAKSSATQATAAAPPLTGDALLLNRVYQHALAYETDGGVLKTFSGKLRSAGYASYANALDQRIAHFEMIAAPIELQTGPLALRSQS